MATRRGEMARRRVARAPTWAQASLRHRMTCGHTWCTRGMSQLDSSRALSADFSASSLSKTALSSDNQLALSPAVTATTVLLQATVPEVPVPKGAPFMILRRRCTSAFTALRCSARLLCAASMCPSATAAPCRAAHSTKAKEGMTRCGL